MHVFCIGVTQVLPVLPGEPAQQCEEVHEEGEPCYKAECAQGLPSMDEPEHC